MEYARYRATASESERDWQSSVLAKRPRNDYENDYTRDTSLSDVYVNGREVVRVADKGGERVGVRLLNDHVGGLDPLIGRRPRNDYEYDYTRDRSALSDAYVNPREKLSLAERVGDRVGVRLLDDHVRAPAPPFLDDHRFVSQTRRLTSLNRLTEEGFNFRSDSHGLNPLIGRRRSVDDIDYLPEDASNTLFVMGVPSDCTTREAAHIFRPFRGFKEVRVVKKPKESKKSNGGGEGEAATAVVVLCFVEFDNPNCAATAMEALQGYRFDENDRDSFSLKLQFDRERSRPYFAHDQDRGRDYYRYRR